MTWYTGTAMLEDMTRPYQNLVAWKEAHSLCLLLLAFTENFPPKERFRLTDQLSRSAMSVPANIAEGSGRYGKADQKRFYSIARASLEEVHYHVFLAKDLGYISSTDYEQLDGHINRIGYLLYKLRNQSNSNLPNLSNMSNVPK